MSKQAFREAKSVLAKALDNNAEWQKAKASGKADKYIKSDESAIITETGYKQYGLSYTPFIDAGRGTGKPPPVKSLFEWLKYKKYGISYSSRKQRMSIAVAMSKSIAKKGSWKFKNKKPSTVFDDVVQAIKPSLESSLQEAQRIKIEAPILKEIQEIQNGK